MRRYLALTDPCFRLGGGEGGEKAGGGAGSSSGLESTRTTAGTGGASPQALANKASSQLSSTVWRVGVLWSQFTNWLIVQEPRRDWSLGSVSLGESQEEALVESLGESLGEHWESHWMSTGRVTGGSPSKSIPGTRGSCGLCS